MICKAKVIKGSIRGISYILDDKGHAVELIRNMMYSETPPEAIYREMLETAHRNRQAQKCFISAFFSPKATNTQNWILADWVLFAETIAHKLKIDKCEYICTLHQSTKTKHVHFYACRIDENGVNRFQNHNIIQKMRTTGEQLDKEYGWESAQNISKTKIAHVKAILLQCMHVSGNVEQLNYRMEQNGFTMKWQIRDGNFIGLRIISNDGNYNYKLSELDRMKVSDILPQLSNNVKQLNTRTSPIIIEMQKPLIKNGMIKNIVSEHQPDDTDEILSARKKKKPKKLNNEIIPDF
jgi:Relaxase/Mobilisation nuclease domain.